MYVWSVVGLFALVGVADVSGLCWKVCTWQQWEGWSTCSRTCGGGIRRRVRALCGWPWWKEDGRFRRCRKSESDSRQLDYCNTLCFHGVWSAWVSGCSCKDGYRGLCCQQQAMYWSGWSAWSACSVTCSGDGVEGRRVRQRKCLGPSDNNVLRGCTGNAAQLQACRPDVPCQDPARKTTPAEDTTTGGYDSTRPAYTTGYTTIHQETTEHEAANETGNSTKHMDTTSPSQLQENTTPLQRTTIPPSDRGDTTIPPSDRGDTTIPLSDRGETTTGTTVNGTPQLYNYTSVDNSTEYPTDNNRTSHDVNRTAVNSDDTTEKNTPSPTTVASQITSDRNGSMWVATSAAPEIVTWTSHTNNDTYYLNGTSYLSSNKTSTGIFNETLHSDSDDDIPFDMHVKTSHSMANNTAKTIHTPHTNTSSWDLKNTNDSSVGNVSRTDSEEITNHPIQNTTSSDFEDIQSDNQVNTSTTDNPVESSSEKVTDQLEIKTTPLNLTESSMSLENVSKYNSDDNATVSPLINTSVSILNKPETDIVTETTLMNTSSQPMSDEQFTTPTGTFIENTTVPLYIPEGPTVVNVEDTTAMSARETVTQRTFTDAEVIAIEEADHAQTNRREREVVPQHKPDMFSGEANNTDIIHTSASTESDRTTMQMPSSATSQSPDSAAILAEKDTSMTSTENVIPVENFKRDATQTENYNIPLVTQNVTVDAFGDHDDVQNATAGPDQTLTELPEKNVSHNRWTDALPETPTTASVPGVISGTTETNMTSEPGNATALRPQQNDTTTRSISLDVPGQTTTTEATGPDRRTTVPTTRASPVPTTSPLIQVIWRWDPQFVIQPKNQSVSLGRAVVFECVTEPPSDITWSFEDQLLTDGSKDGRKVLLNGVLIVPHVRRQHYGKYTCIAKGLHVTKQSSAWINTDSEFRCMTRFIEVPSDAVVREGTLKWFTCLTMEKHQITWLRNGRKIHESSKDKRIRILTNSYLLISPVNVTDSAKYTCVAYDNVTKCKTSVSARLQVYKDVNEVCGRKMLHQPRESLPKRMGYIVGGQDAMLGAAPWQVMLYEATAEGFCSGVLVSSRWVVTAAHCFIDFPTRFERRLTLENLVLKLGKHKQNSRSRHEKESKVALAILHKDFVAGRYNNDIALIKLAEEVEFNDYIRPICMPQSKNVMWNITAPGTLGTVTGWGALLQYGSYPETLNEVRLPLVRQTVCAASTQFSITDNMFCAGYDRDIVRDACFGDSGGPFSVEYLGRWFLVGLVSWGEGCARSGKFGFYTNVSKFTDWLAEGMTITTTTIF